jgi:apolipoprotein N-acyltransferase
VLKATVRGYTGATPYARLGNYLVVSLATLALAAVFAASRRRAVEPAPKRARAR